MRDEGQINGLWSTPETQHREKRYQNDVARKSVPFPLFRPDAHVLHYITVPTELVVQICYRQVFKKLSYIAEIKHTVSLFFSSAILFKNMIFGFLLYSRYIGAHLPILNCHFSFYFASVTEIVA